MNEKQSRQLESQLKNANYLEVALDDEDNHILEYQKEIDNYWIVFKKFQLILFEIGWSAEARFFDNDEAIYICWQFKNDETVKNIERYFEKLRESWMQKE